MSHVAGLARKLLLKQGHVGALVNAPPGYAERLEPLPAGASVSEVLSAGLDFVLLFAASLAELELHAASAASAVRPGGLLWVGYRKGGRRVGTDLNRDLLWRAMARYGQSGVTLVSIDETWSAMRFRPESEVGT
jgi:hypothetical protein